MGAEGGSDVPLEDCPLNDPLSDIGRDQQGPICHAGDKASAPLVIPLHLA